MLTLAQKFWQQENGQGLTEYAFILVFIAMALITGLSFLGGQVRDLLEVAIAGFAGGGD